MHDVASPPPRFPRESVYKRQKDDATRCSPALVDNADRTRPLGYANTNLSGRHFNGETTAFGQRERRRERSECSLRLRIREDTRSDSLKVGSQSVSQIAGQRGQPGPGRRGGKERERKEGRNEEGKRGCESERRGNAWQASTGSISRGKDKFLIGPRYTDDSLLVDLITPRYGGLYKPTIDCAYPNHLLS